MPSTDPAKGDVLPDQSISDVFFRVSLPASQDPVVFAQASGREEAKRIAWQYLKHDPDRYIVEPLTQAEAEVHVSLRPPAVNGLVTRLRAGVEALRALYTEENEERAKAQAQVERLRSAFADLLEEAQDMRAYVPDYFAEKWKHDEAFERAKTALQIDEGEAPRG